MKKLILLFAVLCCQVKAETLRVFMIDAGTPQFTEYYGSTVGGDFSLARDKGKRHFHSEATFKFIMAGDCQEVSCLKPACLDMIVDWCNFYVDENSYARCLDMAIVGQYDIVNMSLAGTDYIRLERAKIEEIAKHSIVVVAAGNEGKNIRAYPASYATSLDGPIVAISAVDSFGKRLPSSNKDDLTVDFLGSSLYYNTQQSMWYSIQGTSVAAALYTNHLIGDMCPSRKKRGKNGQD